MNEFIFVVGCSAHIFLLTMLFISQNTQLQFWPPPNKNSWQYHSLWWSIRILVVCICWLIYSDNSSMNLPCWLRLYVAMPTFIITFSLGSVAAFQLGWRNTHGEAMKFVKTGFYKYSRNPQYVLFSISFLCLGVWASSLKALILLLLLSFWYLLAPFPEERWLEKQYGKVYLFYKRKVPRYFGWPK